MKKRIDDYLRPGETDLPLHEQLAIVAGRIAEEKEPERRDMRLPDITPGPWKAVTLDGDLFDSIVGANGDVVASMDAPNGQAPNCPDTVAIASLPVLLDAAAHLVHDFDEEADSAVEVSEFWLRQLEHAVAAAGVYLPNYRP